MRKIEVEIYKYEELSDAAKKVARQWWKDLEANNGDNSFADHIIDDAVEVAKRLGITIDKRTVKLMNGNTRYDPTIYWSGFGKQGDGACFDGRYDYHSGGVELLKEYAPNDSELHRIATELNEVQQLYENEIFARTTHTSHYCHEHSMTIDVECTAEDENCEPIEVSPESEERIKKALRSFARWIYSKIEDQYEYIMSDDAVSETLISNEYEFTSDGKIY